MKAKTRKTLRNITVEHHYAASKQAVSVTAAQPNLVSEKKSTIILDKYSGVLTVREKDRFAKEKKRFFTPEQLHEIIIFVHTRRRSILDDKKTATVQIFGKTLSNAPILLLFEEPYKNALALASEFSELLDLNLREQPAVVN